MVSSFLEGNVDPLFLQTKVKKLQERISEKNSSVNAVLHMNPHLLAEARVLDAKKTKGRLYGAVIGVKSNINVKGLICNCASKTLENYSAPYDATVIEKIKAEDGLILGMLNMDEFACGWSGETSAFGATYNPVVPGIIAGGSSSGSAAAVAAEFCDLSLGSDTGGSIRNPASMCGVVGVKPSYGAVSRYGLIDLAMSLDQIGAVAHDVATAALLFDVIRGKDERDTTSVASENVEFRLPSQLTLGVLRVPGVDSRIQKLIDAQVKAAALAYGWKTKEVVIPHLNLAVSTYYPLVFAEFFSATRRMDGRRYGKKIEDSCGAEVLRRLLGGSALTKAEFAGAHYRKALQVKQFLREEFETVFQDVDAVVLPTVPGLPWKVGNYLHMSPEELYAYDALTIPANLAGTCALSLPVGGVEQFLMGMQIMCGRGKESLMFSIAREVEKLPKIIN